MRTSYPVCGLALTLLFAPGAARAAGLRVPGPGGELAHPTTTSPLALAHNPAGLARERGTRLYFELALGYHQASYQRPAGAIDHPVPADRRGAGTPADATSANAGRASTLAPILAPTFLGLASDAGEADQAFAFGIHVPIGGSVAWDRNEAFRGDPRYPGAVDGVQRWFLIEGAATGIAATGAYARHFPALGLSVGASVGLWRLDIRTVQARTGGGTDDLVTRSGVLLEGRSLLEVGGFALVLGGGLLWEPAPGLLVGASYESQPNLGEVRLEGRYEAQLGATSNVRGEVELREQLPDVARAGVRWRALPRLELRLSGELQRWSVVRDQCVLDRTVVGRGCRILPDGSIDDRAGPPGVLTYVRRDWQDALGARLGASWLLDAIELTGSAGWDGNAIPDRTLEPGLSDADKFTVAAGFRKRLATLPMTLVATYTQVLYLTRTLAPRARDAEGEPVAPEPPSRTPDPAGRYRRSIGILAVGAEWQI